VLFADLVGSTALAGSQDPERTRATLDRFYEAMAAEIERAGGTVEKFAGDAVMAAFGAPAALEDHAERALHCALAMRRRLQTLFAGELSLRTGVNTGDVVVGRPREGSSFVSGDAVNVAARLEQAAVPDEILIGERTASFVRGAFELGSPRRVEAKGKEEGVVGAPLLRALSLMRPRGVEGCSRRSSAAPASWTCCSQRMPVRSSRATAHGHDHGRRRRRQDAARSRALGARRRPWSPSPSAGPAAASPTATGSRTGRSARS
jgi:class 3 adenylate cyclase